jgi:phosphate:Na+ symporter
MSIFNVLTFIGGLALFLFGMSVMGKSLEKSAGSKLKKIIHKMTTNKFAGLLTGLGVTAIIQSSSATTVMVVGFANSGLMNLGQSINVIMGANIGTTITAWLLSLTGISSDNVFVNLLKPSSFSPILALLGIVLYLFFKKDKYKNIGLILLGFAVLMFGMETMSTSVSGLKNEEWFRNLFLAFENNPFLGVLVGAFVTALIQSSSASVGILQAFATTGQISFGASVPIILGQNIGTTITALLSSIGTNRNAKRASLVHLFFNLIGTVVVLAIYLVIKYAFAPAILKEPASLMGIAIIHTAFNVFCVLLLLPFTKLLEKLVMAILPDKKADVYTEIDERLLFAPSLALEQVKTKLGEMGQNAQTALFLALDSFNKKEQYEQIHNAENQTDYYEDLIGSYLVKLSAKQLNEVDSKTASAYLKIIGDLERIGDHSLNIAKINKEVHEREIAFSEVAKQEIDVCFLALKDIWSLTYHALENDEKEAIKIEPLEQVIDQLVKTVKDNHINRLQNNECSIDKGFVLADLLSNIERISDHCSNIAGYLIDLSKNNLDSHKNIHEYRQKERFIELYDDYLNKYKIKA